MLITREDLKMTISPILFFAKVGRLQSALINEKCLMSGKMNERNGITEENYFQ